MYEFLIKRDSQLKSHPNIKQQKYLCTYKFLTFIDIMQFLLSMVLLAV